MKHDYLALLAPLGVTQIHDVELLQPLWGGYGALQRVSVLGFGYPSIIVKHIRLPQTNEHPRGWNSALSHQRKLRSYQVELNWYQNYASFHDNNCSMPKALLVKQQDNDLMIAMEDLNSLGYTDVVVDASRDQLSACLKWLAYFHAKHIGNTGDGLWESGTYWHLQTRPEELEALEDTALRDAAQAIDHTLASAPFQTLVHGDAKLANFCFSQSGKEVAAVDFQYVGKGCAMKDVALFISSAVKPQDCMNLEASLLNDYFAYLQQALTCYQPHISFEEVEAAWRPLFVVAWADFQRFVKGWCPTHWKINAYTESLKERALVQLRDNKPFSEMS